jgi:hypothetical protein
MLSFVTSDKCQFLRVILVKIKLNPFYIPCCSSRKWVLPFAQWLREYSVDREVKQEQMKPFVQQRDRMYQLISASPFLDSKGREQMLDWLVAYLDKIESYYLQLSQ